MPGVSLYSAACSTGPECTIVGGYTTTKSLGEGLLVTGAGTSWTAAEAPLPPDGARSTDALFESVACPFASTCLAAGTYNNYVLDQPLLVIMLK